MGDLQPAQLGGLGIYGQTALGTAGTGSEYYWFKHNLNDIGPSEIIRDVGQLVGNTLLPAGRMKTGVFSGGRLTMPPALDDYIGWLLYAFAGAKEGTSDVNGDGTFINYFPDKTTGDVTVPALYLTLHKLMTSDDATYDYGEQFMDATVARFQLAVTGGELVTCMFDFLAKLPSPQDVTRATPEQGWDPTEAGYEPKGKKSIPIASRGKFELPDGDSLTTVNAWMVDFVNVTPGVGEVMVVGSFYPHSFPVTGRVPIFNWTQLVENFSLYKDMFWLGSAWTSRIYEADFDAAVQSAFMIESAYDTLVTDVSYTDEAGDPSLTDSGQDFGDYDVTPPTDATHWIKVTNSDGSVRWGFCGESPGATEIVVYKDLGTTVNGWNGGSVSGKTPSDYDVHSVRRYELGIKAGAVGWTATPVAQAGGTLLRTNVTGQLEDSEGTALDWHIWLQNMTQNYTWPT